MKIASRATVWAPLVYMNWIQNRRQKVFNSGVLRLLKGIYILKFDENSTDL